MEERKAGYDEARYPRSEMTGRIIGAGQRIHRGLGPGFGEMIYHRALAVELSAQSLGFGFEVRIPINYRCEWTAIQRVDFNLEDVMVGVKAKAKIEDFDLIQTLS